MSHHVLVIDDSELIREAATIGLSVEGWSVETAPNGERGLQAVATRRPDVVLLDVVMEGMDGLAVLERLRADDATRSLPVVLLTADAGAAEGHPADGIIVKPFAPLGLASAIRDTLGWAS